MKKPNKSLHKTNRFFLIALMMAGALIVLLSLPSGYVWAEATQDVDPEKPALSDARGIDPFLPFIKIAPDKAKVAKLKEAASADAKAEPIFVPPLERYDVHEFRLRGVARGASQNVAVVEDGGGKIYTLYRGTAIGLLGGRVVAILPDMIIVEQKELDSSGKEIAKQITLRLERDEDRGKL